MGSRDVDGDGRKLTSIDSWILVVAFVAAGCGTRTGLGRSSPADGESCPVVWTRSVHEGIDSAVGGVAVDSAGNVYVTGWTFTSGWVFYLWVRKYDGDGAELWMRSHDPLGPRSSTDVAVSSDGGVLFASGHESHGPASWVRKHDGDGAELWTQTYQYRPREWLGGIATDGGAGFVVVGFTGPDNEEHEAVVRRCDPTGRELWLRTEPFGSAFGAATDRAGNVLVTGYVRGSTDDTWIAKYGPDGDELWARTYDGGGEDAGFDVAVDVDGNVIVAGHTSTASGSDAWLRKYDPEGGEVWTVVYSSPEDDAAIAVEADSEGNVAVVGTTRAGVDADADAWVRKYDTDGRELWVSTLDGPSYDQAGGVAVDGDGSVLAGGATRPGGDEGPQRAWLRKYCP